MQYFKNYNSETHPQLSNRLFQQTKKSDFAVCLKEVSVLPIVDHEVIVSDEIFRTDFRACYRLLSSHGDAFIDNKGYIIQSTADFEKEYSSTSVQFDIEEYLEFWKEFDEFHKHKCEYIDIIHLKMSRGGLYDSPWQCRKDTLDQLIADDDKSLAETAIVRKMRDKCIEALVEEGVLKETIVEPEPEPEPKKPNPLDLVPTEAQIACFNMLCTIMEYSDNNLVRGYKDTVSQLRDVYVLNNLEICDFNGKVAKEILIIESI